MTARFWSKVAIGAPDECWPWTGSVNEHGYGGIRLGGRSGRLWKAHRIAYLITHPGEKLAPADHICHHCDNPPCCNPAHLYKGDYRTNVDDMVRRGRQSKGEARSAQLKGRMASGDAHWTHIRPATHCQQGHAFDEENTAMWGGRRRCRVCANEGQRRRRAA